MAPIVSALNGRNSPPPQPTRSLAAKGQTVYLAVPGQGTVWICDTADSMSEMVSFSVQKNEQGITRMMHEGRLMVAFKNTRATVMEPGLMSYQVKIEEGKHAERTGFIATEHVHTSPL